MTLSEDLQWRGLIKDTTFTDMAWLDTPRTFYLGQDGSADSLTIGNLAILLTARRLAAAGWKTVLLVGGATGLIGDPGGKESERELKSHEEVSHNVEGIKAQVTRLFAGHECTIVNNYDWFKDLGYLEFLRDVGKHYSMTELVQRDFIATRMGEGGGGISYAEFSYSLIQGYDFWYLFKHHGVVMQIGGSDQWGNMLSGVPLIRKKESLEGRETEAQAFSMPLVINKTTGRKFGKSEDGAVWLDPARTTPTQFYQFWINVDDAGVEDYLKIYTFLSKEEIESIIAEHQANPAKRHAQQRLAAAITELVHGKEQTEIAQQITGVLTGQQPVKAVSEAVLASLRTELAALEVHASEELTVSDILVNTKLASSKTEARRLIQDKAITIDGQKVEEDSVPSVETTGQRFLIRRGKKFKDSALIELL
jgi:tyrosyl-tRNA synthetase